MKSSCVFLAVGVVTSLGAAEVATPPKTIQPPSAGPSQGVSSGAAQSMRSLDMVRADKVLVYVPPPEVLPGNLQPVSHPSLPGSSATYPAWRLEFSFTNVSPITAPFKWAILVNGQPVASGEETVAGGAAAVVSKSWPAPPGTHEILGMVDAASKNAESSDMRFNNQTANERLTIGRPIRLSMTRARPYQYVTLTQVRGVLPQAVFVFPRANATPVIVPATVSTNSEGILVRVPPPPPGARAPGVRLVIDGRDPGAWQSDVPFDFLGLPGR